MLDLVLATQGWRRFAEQTPSGYVRWPTAPTEEYKNLLVTNGQYSVWTDPAAVREQRKQLETYLPRYEAAKKARDAAQAVLVAAKADRSAEKRAPGTGREGRGGPRRSAGARPIAPRPRPSPSRDSARRGGTAWPGSRFWGCMLAGLCLARPAVRLPLGIGSAGALGLVAFLVFALGTAEKSQAATRDQSVPQPPRRLRPSGGHATTFAAEGVVAGDVEDDVGSRRRSPISRRRRSCSGGCRMRGSNLLPQQGVGGAKRAKMAGSGGPSGVPILPRVDPSAPSPPMAAGCPAAGCRVSAAECRALGVMGGNGCGSEAGGGSAESFLGRLTEGLQPPPPKMKAAAEPTSGVAGDARTPSADDPWDSSDRVPWKGHWPGWNAQGLPDRTSPEDLPW